MSEITRVALDAMGGDNAPREMVKGAVEAVQKRKDIKVLLTGKEDVIRKELSAYTYPKEQIEIVNATEVIETAEPPVKAIRGKKDSSIVVAMKMVKKGEADAFVSAGSSGAVLVGGQVLVGRIKGVERPPLAPLIPTLKGVSLLIDCGANVDARPSHLVQFAKMGSIYMESVMGKKNPTVGIVNIGAEEEKGNYVVEEEPGKFRRIIASPMPIDIYEIDAVKALLDADQVVIAAGGGGIPVLQQGSHLKGASAIIEKDYTAAKLAELVGAGTLLFLTAYDKLTIGKGTPEEKVFDTVSATDLHQYIKDGHFPAVTTFPKVDASIRFVTADKERKAVIANLEKAKEGLAGKTGTTITA